MVAGIVLGWLDEYELLFRLLVELRYRSHDAAGAAVLAVPAARRMRQEWELWEEFAGITRTEADARLSPFLGSGRIAGLRFALWGTESDPSDVG